MNAEDKIYSIEEIKNILNKNREFLRNKFNAVNFLLFGSYAKGEQTSESDIDFLVEFDASKNVDMFDFIDLQEYLEELFGKNIDLGTPKGLKSFIKSAILKEAISL